ncbi:MAG: phosphotransferase [Kibdelosporangium sp.]
MSSERIWNTGEWRQVATDWLDEHLGAAGIRRTGEVTQPRVRPWGTVLTAETSAGRVWLKAPGPETVFEVRLYELLRKIAPEWIVPPIALDLGQGLLLLPDGGTTLWESGTDPVEGMLRVLPQYAQLQRHLMPHVENLLAAGVADMRAPVMLERFDEAVAAVARRASPQDTDLVRQIAARRDVVAGWCEQLGALSIPASLDHNDLHAKNVFVDGGRTRFYDWGDSVVAHPFASMIVGWQGVALMHGLAPDDPAMNRLRDAYLEPFGDLAPRGELVVQLELACRVGVIARTLVWERALAAGDGTSDFETGPLETLRSVLRDEWS